MRLENKIALVIGASRGIGRGIAHKLAREGALCMLSGRNQPDLDHVVAEISTPERPAQYVVSDVCKESDMVHLFKIAQERYGRLDIVAINAGIYPQAWLEEMTLAQWNEVISTNLNSVFLATRLSIPMMKQQRYGRIVITSSVSGPQVGLPGFSHYTASKAGISGFIKSAAIELAHYNITLNAVEPGNIMTEGLMDCGEGHIQNMAQAIPMKRLGTVDDVANAVSFLASDEASFITGQSIIVDGGQILPESAFLRFHKDEDEK